MAEKDLEQQEKKIDKQHIKLIVVMLLAVLLVIFAIQNSQEVMIRLWFWRFHTSMALALMICLIGGFLLSFWYFIPLLQKKNQLLNLKEKEITRLRGGREPGKGPGNIIKP